jgi:hypothetical protein
MSKLDGLKGKWSSRYVDQDGYEQRRSRMTAGVYRGKRSTIG